MSDLLHLPPELRLNVYHHVLVASMADGRAADAGGLLLSCCAVYEELRADFLPAVTMILNTMSQWKLHYADGTIKVDLHRDYSFRHPPTEATITFPYGPKWTQGRYVQDDVKTAISRLEPLLGHPWDDLTFRVYSNDSNRLRPNDVRGLYAALFKSMRRDFRPDKLRHPYFSRTKRLTMSLDMHSDLDDGAVSPLALLHDSDLYSCYLSKTMTSHDRGCKTRITKKDTRDSATWSLVFDFDAASEH